MEDLCKRDCLGPFFCCQSETLKASQLYFLKIHSAHSLGELRAWQWYQLSSGEDLITSWQEHIWKEDHISKQEAKEAEIPQFPLSSSPRDLLISQEAPPLKGPTITLRTKLPTHQLLWHSFKSYPTHSSDQRTSWDQKWKKFELILHCFYLAYVFHLYYLKTKAFIQLSAW